MFSSMINLGFKTSQILVFHSKLAEMTLKLDNKHYGTTISLSKVKFRRK